jgi:hypothetical protein
MDNHRMVGRWISRYVSVEVAQGREIPSQFWSPGVRFQGVRIQGFRSQGARIQGVSTQELAVVDANTRGAEKERRSRRGGKYHMQKCALQIEGLEVGGGAI